MRSLRRVLPAVGWFLTWGANDCAWARAPNDSLFSTDHAILSLGLAEPGRPSSRLEAASEVRQVRCRPRSTQHSAISNLAVRTGARLWRRAVPRCYWTSQTLTPAAWHVNGFGLGYRGILGKEGPGAFAGPRLIPLLGFSTVCEVIHAVFLPAVFGLAGLIAICNRLALAVRNG